MATSGAPDVSSSTVLVNAKHALERSKQILATLDPAAPTRGPSSPKTRSEKCAILRDHCAKLEALAEAVRELGPQEIADNADVTQLLSSLEQLKQRITDECVRVVGDAKQKDSEIPLAQREATKPKQAETKQATANANAISFMVLFIVSLIQKVVNRGCDSLGHGHPGRPALQPHRHHDHRRGLLPGRPGQHLPAFSSAPGELRGSARRLTTVRRRLSDRFGL